MRTVSRPLRGFLALTAAALLVAPPAWSSSVTETLGDGRATIDWTKGTVTVTGSGAPPDRGSLAQKRLLARRAAVVDGYRQLAELITGVRVDSETVVKDFVIESDVIRTQVNALVKGATAGEPRYLDDGSVEVDLKVSLHGPASLFAAVDFDKKIAKPIPQPEPDTTASQPETEAVKPSAQPTPSAKPSAKPVPTPNPSEETPVELTKPTANPAPTPEPKPSSAAGQPGSVTAPARPNAAKTLPADAYTGVIIDCRDTAIQPAMSPAILDEAGKELYVGKMPIDPDMVINVGIVGYADSLDDATDNDERIGKHPLVIKAKRTSGQYKADVVLSAADAADLLKANEVGKFLTQSRVMFVLKP